MFRIRNLEDFLVVAFPFTESFQQWPQLPENRNYKTGHCLMPECDEPPGSKIDIGPCETPSMANARVNMRMWVFTFFKLRIAINILVHFIPRKTILYA